MGVPPETQPNSGDYDKPTDTQPDLRFPQVVHSDSPGSGSTDPQPAGDRITRVQLEPGRYSWQRLVDAMGTSEAAAARRVGISGSTLKAARERGLVEKAADRYAVRAGLHPFEVWPEMAEQAIAAASRGCRECGQPFLPRTKVHLFCTVECGRRFRGRLYAAQRRATPVGRAENIEKVRAWRASLSPAAVRAQQAKQRRRHRAWLEANREQIRAYRAVYRRERYRTDPEYRERVLAKQRERDRAKAAKRAA